MATWFDDIRESLDTETKALLWPESPDKFVSTGVESYSLLLLDRGPDDKRIEPVIAAIQEHGAEGDVELPFVVATQLELDDAIAGQLALACCDCVSAFIRDDLLNGQQTDFFIDLYSEVMNSSEYQTVEVRVEQFPRSDVARKVSWQFFGMAEGISTPALFRMYRKKARLFMKWANDLNATAFAHEF